MLQYITLLNLMEKGPGLAVGRVLGWLTFIVAQEAMGAPFMLPFAPERRKIARKPKVSGNIVIFQEVNEF